jgi:hypothetical protein
MGNPHKEAAEAQRELELIKEYVLWRGVGDRELDKSHFPVYTLVKRLASKRFSVGYNTALDRVKYWQDGRHHGKDKVHK